MLARGDEPTLKSPLADSLPLAACCQVNAPVRLLVAGPGLDGELSHEALRGILGPLVHTFTAADTEPISQALEWHPSEATGILAAAAQGVRGTCKVRDVGLPIPLIDESPTLHEVDLDEAVSRNELSRALMSTTTLDEAEALSREICGFSEIDPLTQATTPDEARPRVGTPPTRPVRGRGPKPRNHPHDVPPPHRGPEPQRFPAR